MLTYTGTAVGRWGWYRIRARLQPCREKRVQRQGFRVCVKTGGSAAPLCGRAQPFRAEDSMSIDKQRFCRRAGKPEAFRTAGRRSRTNRELPVFTQALVAPRFSPALVFNEVPT